MGGADVFIPHKSSPLERQQNVSSTTTCECMKLESVNILGGSVGGVSLSVMIYMWLLNGGNTRVTLDSDSSAWGGSGGAVWRRFLLNYIFDTNCD